MQRQAIEEVAQLPKGHPYRQNTLELLGNLKVTLEARTIIRPEERDLIMQLSPLYLEQIQAAKQEGKQEGKQEVKQEGKQEVKQEIALRMLKENISLETISRITELSLDRLQQLRSSL